VESKHSLTMRVYCLVWYTVQNDSLISRVGASDPTIELSRLGCAVCVPPTRRRHHTHQFLIKVYSSSLGQVERAYTVVSFYSISQIWEALGWSSERRILKIVATNQKNSVSSRSPSKSDDLSTASAAPHSPSNLPSMSPHPSAKHPSINP
jgi:hypothetical protein